MRPSVPAVEATVLLVGAAVGGAVARWAAVEAFPPSAPLDWPLIAVNGVGCALIGWAAVRLRREVHAAAVTLGFCGAFTSASSFAVEVAVRFDEGAVAAGAAHVVLTVAAATVGFVSGRRLALASSRTTGR